MQLDTSDGSQTLGDEEALAIVMRNLVGNALRYARSRIQIDVSGHDRTLTFAVLDDGPGFSQEGAIRAFHRFFRGTEEGHESDGAGLGLALVLRIVKLHAGSARIVAGIEGGAGVALTLERYFAGRSG